MGLHKLEVTIFSARDLKNVKLLGGTMDPYCVAWLNPHSKVSSPVNKGGGVHPTWNAIITFMVDTAILEQGNATITVEIYNHGKFSSKLIGTASIPLRDVQSASKAGIGASKASAYRVRRKSGKHQGVINVVVQTDKGLLDKEVVAESTPPGRGVLTMAKGRQYEGQQYMHHQLVGRQYSQARYDLLQQQQGTQKNKVFGDSSIGMLGGLSLISTLDSISGYGGSGGGCGSSIGNCSSGGGCGSTCGGFS